MQLMTPRYLEFVRRFVDTVTARSLVGVLEHTHRETLESERLEDDALELRDQRAAA